MGVPPSPAARTDGIAAQAGAARGPLPTEPPRSPGFALTLPDRSAEDTMTAILQQLQRQQQQETHWEQQMLQMRPQMLHMQQALAGTPEARAYSPPWAGAGPYPEKGDPGYGPPDPGLFEEPPGRVSPAVSTSSAASVASTSRWPSVVHKSLHRLRKVLTKIG